MTDKQVVSAQGKRQSVLAGLLSSAESVEARLPATEGEWRRLAVQAVRGGCAGLLLEALERRGVEAPEGVRQVLCGAATETARRNRRHRQQVEQLAEAFSREGVELMLLKGAALNEVLYKRADLRPMADLDLLIRPEDAPRAGVLFGRLGFVRGASQVREDFFPRFYYEAHYWPGHGAGLLVDLHVRPWRPLPYLQTVPPEALWGDSRTVKVGTGKVRVPGYEGMFLHLAVHAACHGASRLLWLVDMQRLAREVGTSLDWDRLVGTARAWKLCWPLLRGMEAVAEVLGEAWPAGVMGALRASRVSWRDRLVVAQAPQDAAHPVRHVLADLLCTRGFRFRLSYLAAMLFPGSDHMGQWYRRRHRGWLPVAHVLRWGRATVRPLVER